MKTILNTLSRPKSLAVAVVVVAIVIVTAGIARSRSGSLATLPLKRGDLTTAIYGSAQLKTDRSFDLKLGTLARITDIRKSLGETVQAGETVVLFDTLAPFKAPISGMITALHFRKGETVFAQTTVLTISEAKNFYLEMSLDQKSVRHVRRGQVTQISFDGYRDLKVEGSVRSTFSSNSLFYAVIDLTTTDPSFLPGMSADVAIVTDVKKGVLLAPLGALKDGKLLLQRSGKTQSIGVSVGPDDGAFAEVSSPDIHEGDLVVLPSALGKGRGK